MANEFGVSTKTFCRWLKREGVLLSKGLISIKDQEEIYTLFGKPYDQK